MRNAVLEEPQAGIKIAGRNIMDLCFGTVSIHSQEFKEMQLTSLSQLMKHMWILEPNTFLPLSHPSQCEM